MTPMWLYASGSQQWKLNMLGNWDELLTDANGDGDYIDMIADAKETRTHNEANEITDRDYSGAGSASNQDRLQGKAGNLTREKNPAIQAGRQFTHDAWNRLVKIEVLDASGTPAANPSEYEYNGLHWRTIRKSKNGTALQVRRMFYSAGWHLCEEHIDDDTVGAIQETTTQDGGVLHSNEIGHFVIDRRNPAGFAQVVDMSSRETAQAATTRGSMSAWA